MLQAKRGDQEFDGSLPPGPPLPAMAIMLLRTLWPLEWLDFCQRHYGSPFTLNGQGRKQVFFSHPDHQRAILTADPDHAGVQASSTLGPLVGERAIFGLSGPEHRAKRKLLMPSFHGRSLQGYSDLIREAATRVFAQQEKGRPFSIRAAMRRVTLSVISRIVLGGSLASTEEIEASFVTLMDQIFSSPLGLLAFKALSWDLGARSPRGQFLRDLAVLDGCIYEAIRRRRLDPSLPLDLLARLVSATDGADRPLTDGEIRDEVVTLLFAGHETTASALAWAVYCLGRFPGIRERLVSALAEVSSSANVSDIIDLPYLDAFCRETLRMFPPSPMARRIVKRPFQVGEFTFGTGTMLVSCVYLTHQLEELYPSPREFRPERFLDRKYTPYEFLPFGGGEHRCLGETLAILEMKLILMTLLETFDVKVLDSRPVRPVSHGPVVAPPAHLRMVVE